MHFIQLLTVNFCEDALIIFQRAVLDNANGRPIVSHHEIWFTQFRFCKIMESLKSDGANRLRLSQKIFFSSQITIQSRIRKFEFCRNSIENTKRPIWFSLNACEPIYRFSSSCQLFFGWSDIVDMPTAISETFPWHFDGGFYSISVFQKLAAIPDELPLHPSSLRFVYPIWNFWNQCRLVSSREWIFHPWNFDFMSCVSGILTKLELMPKSKHITSFLHTYLAF